MAKVTFDGVSQIITVDTGITTLYVGTDLYSDWKEWFLINPEFAPAFRAVGGDLLRTGYYLDGSYFLTNGWRIRPQESNHTLTVVGNLYVDGSEDSPFIRTIGNYNVMVNMNTSNIVSAIAGEGSITAQDKDDIIDGVTSNMLPYLRKILGLSHHNFRFTNQAYDVDGNMTSASVFVYNNAVDLANQTNHLLEYTIAASYTSNRVNNYKMSLVYDGTI